MLLQTTPPFLGRGQSGGGGGGGWTTETLVFNDTFTEASNTNLNAHTPDLGTGWTTNGTASNIRVEASLDRLWVSGGIQPRTSFIQDSVAANQAVQIDFRPTAELSGVMARGGYYSTGSSQWTGYALIYNDGTAALDLYKYDGSSFTLLDSASISASDFDTMRLECFGTSIKGLHNGSEVVSATDSTYSSGTAGVRMRFGLNTTIADNFKVYELT